MSQPQDSGKTKIRMRVLVVDDHEVVRRGVIALLTTESNYDVCGEATSGVDALAKTKALRPDVVIMDVSMPTLNGIEATRMIRNAVPSCEVLILSQHDATEMAHQAFKAGARGYVVKSSLARNLFAALDKVAKHESFFDPAIAEFARPIDLQEVLQRSTALEQALRESEQLYRSTFELAAVGVAHVSPDGRWLRVNQKLCDIVGYTEAELLGLTFQEITHPDDLGADLAELDRLVRGEIPTFSMEKRYIRKNRSAVWVNLTVSPARDKNGKLKHFISLIEDVSNRREAEEAKARLAAIVECSDDAVISKDLTGIIQSWNAAATRTFGYTAEEAIGKSITILIPKELQDEEARILARLRSGERIDHFETIRVAKSGKRLNISLTISPVRDARGRIIGASKIARDITERKRVEQALHESQAQLTLALESSRTAMFDWDVNLRRGSWNDQLATLYDFRPAENYITAEEWLSLFHPDDVGRLVRENEQTLRENDKFQFEYRTAPRGGETKWILSHGRVVRDTQGKALGLIGTHTDITDRKLVEQALQQRQAELNEAQRLTKIGSWHWNFENDVVLWSEEMYRITGRDLNLPAPSYGESVSLHTPESWARLRTAVSEAQSNGTPFSVELEMVRPDRSVRTVICNGEGQRNLSGAIIALRGTVQDVTEQKKAEMQRRRSADQLRAAIGQTYSFFVLLELDGTIIEANRAALEAADCSREQVVGRKFWEPWWSPLPDEVEVLKSAIARAASGHTTRGECYFCAPGGARRFADRTLSPVKDEAGHVTMIVATGLDTTEQKELRDRLEERVLERTRELREKNQALLHQAATVRELSGKLLQVQDEERRRIARELHDSAGQLIAALQMNLIPMKSEADTLNVPLSQGLSESLDLLQQLSDELRTVSYLLHPPLLDEAGLGSALSWYVEGFVARSKIEVQLEISPGLGRMPREIEMTIFRVVQESLTNIHRHSGSKQARICISRSSEELSLEVRDFGKGMPKSGGNGSATTLRSGVGIQGMQERVRQLSGRFEIQSQDTGTVVTVLLPVKTPSLALV